MTATPWSPHTARRRPSDSAREALRLTDAVADALGRTVRTGRRRCHLTQAQLGQRVSVHQSWISRIELGGGQGVPLELWIRIGLVIGQPLAISFSKPLAASTRDSGHLDIQEFLLALARMTGRPATFELPTRPANPSHSIDVCVRDGRSRILFIEEAWNTFDDLGAATRSTHRKVAEAIDLARTIDDGPPYRVASVWVVRDIAANRFLVGRYPEIMRTSFPGSSLAWAKALTTGAEPPHQPGLVWYDSATRRVHPWRSANRLQGQP